MLLYIEQSHTFPAIRIKIAWLVSKSLNGENNIKVLLKLPAFGIDMIKSLQMKMPVHYFWTTSWRTFHLTFIFNHLFYESSLLGKRKIRINQWLKIPYFMSKWWTIWITMTLLKNLITYHILGNPPSLNLIAELEQTFGGAISSDPTILCYWRQILTYQHETYEVSCFYHLCAIHLLGSHCILDLPIWPCSCLVLT